jgi:hypothetical protein
VDLDRNLEIALLTMDGSVSLWTIDETHHPHTVIDWGCWFHDNWHTGWLHPAAPTGLVAERGNPGVRLTWRRNPEPDIVGYCVFRLDYTGWFQRLTPRPIADTTYLDTTAVGDTTRYYKVSAFTRAGSESRQSASVSINPSGIAQVENGEVRIQKWGATVARNVLDLPVSAFSIHYSLFDPSGREVASLRPGPNDVGHLAPGVYVLRQTSGGECPASNVRSVIVIR